MPSLTVFSNWPSSRYDSASFLKASISGRSAGQLLGYGGTGSTAYAYNACTDNRVRASMHAAQLKPHTHELRPVAVIAPHTSKGPGVDIATDSCLLGCRLMHALLHWYQCLRALSDLSWWNVSGMVRHRWCPALFPRKDKQTRCTSRLQHVMSIMYWFYKHPGKVQATAHEAWNLCLHTPLLGPGDRLVTRKTFWALAKFHVMRADYPGAQIFSALPASPPTRVPPCIFTQVSPALCAFSGLQPRGWFPGRRQCKGASTAVPLASLLTNLIVEAARCACLLSSSNFLQVFFAWNLRANASDSSRYLTCPVTQHAINMHLKLGPLFALGYRCL